MAYSSDREISYNTQVKLRADKRGRISCREFFPPEAMFEVKRQPDGSVLLVELVEKRVPRAKLVRRNGSTYIDSDRIITNEDVAKALEDFP